MDLFLLNNSPAVGEQAELAFQTHAARLREMLPYAQIEHVGSTSIPGALGKGDLDIVVCVDDVRFEAADAALAQRFERNTKSIRDGNFSSFKDDSLSPPLGIQLVVRGSEYDNFLKFRDALRTSPRLLEQFNALKQEWHGAAMSDYRSAKSAFIADVLSNS
jgi:GrpB-like predicted nucleotidyltransferase (UPF0157 family)